jgi:RNA polymerase sigma-70 factor (ECF subfamily)
MESTSRSLLVRAGQGHEPAWQQLVGLYRPLIHGHLLRQGVQPQEADDLAQDVLTVLVRELPHFEHAGRPGAFRSWLRQVTVNRAREFWRSGRCRTAAIGGSAFLDQLQQLEDASSVLAQQWDREHDHHVLRHLLAQLHDDFAPTVIRAFQRVAIDGAAADEVAEELGMTVGAVYTAKSRVLARLREEAAGLID